MTDGRLLNPLLASLMGGSGTDAAPDAVAGLSPRALTCGPASGVLTSPFACSEHPSLWVCAPPAYTAPAPPLLIVQHVPFVAIIDRARIDAMGLQQRHLRLMYESAPRLDTCTQLIRDDRCRRGLGIMASSLTGACGGCCAVEQLRGRRRPPGAAAGAGTVAVRVPVDGLRRAARRRRAHDRRRRAPAHGGAAQHGAGHGRPGRVRCVRGAWMGAEQGQCWESKPGRVRCALHVCLTSRERPLLAGDPQHEGIAFCTFLILMVDYLRAMGSSGG